jgi:hypothetical protein
MFCNISLLRYEELPVNDSLSAFKARGIMVIAPEGLFKDFSPNFSHNPLHFLSLGFERKFCSPFSLENRSSPSFFSHNLCFILLLFEIKHELVRVLGFWLMI